MRCHDEQRLVKKLAKAGMSTIYIESRKPCNSPANKQDRRTRYHTSKTHFFVALQMHRADVTDEGLLREVLEFCVFR